MKKFSAKSVVLIVIICLIAILLLSLMVVSNLNKDNKEIKTTSTTTTEKIEEELSFVDENYNINVSLKKNDKITNDIKLLVEKVDNINIINDLIGIYDIKFVDENNNVIEVKDNEITISIPYDNSLNYKGFNVLYLSDTNEVLETISATYVDGLIKFKTTHLSKYAIQGIKDEETITTTKKVNVPSTTTKRQETTTKKVETTKTPTTTKKVETTKIPTTTKKVETTKPTTTNKVKKYSYYWDETETSSIGQQRLYIVDEDGKKVSGTITVTFVGTTHSEVLDVPVSGILYVRDIITITSVKGN